MKFIFITDTHGRANNPASRLDDYPETLRKKLSWAVEQANAHDAHLLHGGDWVNRPDTAPSVIGDIAEILGGLHKKPCFCVLGNHDLYGYNPDSFQRTPLSILAKVGLIRVLGTETAAIISHNEDDKVALTGASAVYDIDGSPKYYKPRRIPHVDKHIHIVHGFLTDHPWPDVPHVLINDVLDTEVDVILSGHEHSGYGIVTKNGTTFCNPGALLRVTAGVGDINSVVRAALIDTHKGVSFLNVPEDIALPADKVLDREKLLKEKEHEAKVNAFFSSLSEADLDMFDTTDVFSTFAAFAKAENIEPDLQELITGYLGVASEKAKREEDSDE